MRLFRFVGLPGRAITQFGSVGASIYGVAHGEGRYQIGCLRLEPGGVLGAHAAVTGQFLQVIDGEGWVSGGDGVKRPIRQGIAAYWETGEEHETSSDTGLTALVLESETLEPAQGLIEVAPGSE